MKSRTAKVKKPTPEPVYGDSDRIRLLKMKELRQLEQSEIQAILDSMYRKYPAMKKNYDRYDKYGGWDMRFIG